MGTKQTKVKSMDKIKGYRTAIVAVLGLVLSTIDSLREIVELLLSFVNVEMGDQGASAAIVALVVGIKAIIVDVIPKWKGTLNK